MRGIAGFGACAESVPGVQEPHAWQECVTSGILFAGNLPTRCVLSFLRLAGRPGFATDFKLRAQAEDAVGSICRNIAEGFGCESNIEFARFLEISRRSANETQDCLRQAELKGYVDAADTAPLFILMRRLYPAINNFRAYLLRTARTRRTNQKRSNPQNL